MASASPPSDDFLEATKRRLIGLTVQTPTLRIVIRAVIAGPLIGTDYVRFDWGTEQMATVSLAFVLSAFADGVWTEVDDA